MIDEGAPDEALARFATGVPGLDTVLRGGFLRGGVYLLLGRPGAGKTVLSNQMAYRHVGGGGRALYVTVLSESHSRMLTHLRSFSFFDPSTLARTLLYVSAYQTLEKDGLPGLLRLLRKEVRDHRATMLIIDGLATAAADADSEVPLKKFVHELKAFTETVGCTSFLLTSVPAPGMHYPAQTMVDGIVLLTASRVGMRSVRELEVSKFRGSDSLDGLHHCEITGDGFVVYPRLEALYQRDAARLHDAARTLSLGSPTVDDLFGDGVQAGTATLVIGGPGTGKTLLSLAYLADGAARGERGLFVGFQEPASRLLAKAAGVGVDLAGAVEAGHVELRWQPALELLGDAALGQLLDELRARPVQRLVIDSVDVLRRSVAYPERSVQMLSAVVHELAALGITTVLTHESTNAVGRDVGPLPEGLGSVAENIVAFIHEADDDRLRRRVLVLKKRSGVYDDRIRELTIDSGGIRVATGGGTRGGAATDPNTPGRRPTGPRTKR